MNFESDIFIRLLIAALLILIWVLVNGAVLYLIHFLLTLPMRRAERARLFLDLVDTALAQGQPLEETLISISHSRDQSMGVRFHLLAAWLEQNHRLGDALAKVPRFLPPQVTAMLMTGQKIGDLGKVLPACRQLLKDGLSQTRGAISYLIILTLVLTPMGLWVFGVMNVFVVPKFLEIGRDMGGDVSGVKFLFNHTASVIVLQLSVVCLLWLAAFVYIGGPRVVSWFPILEKIHYRMPWRRKRMQRDFSTMLAVLLDAGMTEPEAVTFAADCTSNKMFRRRAARVVEKLQQGTKLPQAILAMDDSGEIGWRLANAFHSGKDFLQALAGWHESLDAKAFQLEQAAAHGITSGLVLWSGVFVGATVIYVFMFLISIINAGVLW